MNGSAVRAVVTGAPSPAPAEILGGDPAMAAVQRALTEFRAGRPAIVTAPSETDLLVVPVDGLSAAKLAACASLGGGRHLLIVSETRAAALGAIGAAAGAVVLSPQTDLGGVLSLAASGTSAGPAIQRLATFVDTGLAGVAATELAKLALLLPAVIAVELEGAAAPGLEFVPQAASADILGFPEALARSLRLVSSARVPLARVADTLFSVFRDGLGHSWTAVQVGQPDRSRPVAVRLHSACLTGDAFGSLRCDCGDQLRLSIDLLQREGGGYLLYLDQEGCGIGLANKMRAYRLQDNGLDTIDANTMLGFERDERRYDIAARMLQMLGVSRIVLLTNNPLKIAGLRRAGIDIVERIALLAPIHDDNRLYLEAKQKRAGHLIDETA